MTTPSPAKLLKAKDILQHSWCSGVRVRRGTSEEENRYCALGAIGKSHGVSDKDLRSAYDSIPIEDVVVLANVINPHKTKETIERIKEDPRYVGDFHQIVYLFNDRRGQEATLRKFSQACKEYKKHLPVVEDFRRAIEGKEQQGGVIFAYDS